MKYVLSICLCVSFYIASFFILSISQIVDAQALDCTDPSNRAQCLAELDKTEKEIAELNQQLASKQKEASSIARDKALLEIETQKAKLKIKTHEYSIAKLGKDIVAKESNIKLLGTRIEKSRQGLAEMIVRSQELDSFSLTEILLAQEDMSGFFQDLDAYASIQSRIQDELGYIRKDKTATEKEKEELDEKRDEEYDSKYAVETQKKIIEKAEAEKQRLLNLNKKEQATYQGTIAEKAAMVTKIKNALFQLRDTGAIKFEDAVAYAKRAGKSAGVRPAFILAILQQESNLGSNVGSCYMTNPETGSGIKVSSGAAVLNVMKPSRDVQPFLAITKALGRDPFTTRVSCPFTIGFGGAMGPAQFIPSTWQIFAERIAKANGGGVANPWNAGDAFTASAMYLSDLGAKAQTASAERNAACRYYSGKACGSSGNTFYGDQVMARALKLQGDIDLIQD